MVALPDGINSNHIRTVGTIIVASVYYAQKVVCDFCDRPLEFDQERGSYVLYRTKRIGTRKLLPHLCKTCAEKLYDIFLLLKVGRLTKADILDRYAKLNQERREKLGTKG